MPELPEVEVTRRRLAPAWIGRRITRVVTGPPSYFFLTRPDLLAARLRGRVTTDLTRHGKYLLAAFDDGSRLLCHLGMTGQLFTCTSAEARRLLGVDPHVHLALALRDPAGERSSLLFRDVRKFGKVQWLAPGATAERLAKMGPDAIRITPRALHAALAQRGVPIKAALPPTRPARTLSLAECDTLVRSLRRVLQAAIRAVGSTISDFRGADGAPGSYQDNHRVYGRPGLPCPTCGTPIARVVLA